jgi:hypothetical protein
MFLFFLLLFLILLVFLGLLVFLALPGLGVYLHPLGGRSWPCSFVQMSWTIEFGFRSGR